MQAQLPMQTGKFPFGLDDLKSWTVKRKDGTITKYNLSTAAITNSGATTDTTGSNSASTRTVSSYSNYCAHTPKNIPLVTFPRAKGEADLRLWVANMSGAKQTRDAFDFVIDAGDILTLAHQTQLLEGDEQLCQELNDYITAAPPVRILKIDWDDRQAPLVDPEFWVQLNKLIYGDVMTCCVGGHGRSGTTFTCLTLVNAPDYDALDAIVHTRAVHCPRAIESVVQHEYIDTVAKHLKRVGNSKDANMITNYKEAFMASTKPTAIRTRLELGWDKVTK